MRLWLLSAMDYSTGAMHYATCVADLVPDDDAQQRVWACERPLDKMVLAGRPRLLRAPVVVFRDGTVDDASILSALTISLGHCGQRLLERLRQTLLADFPITVMDYEEGFVFHAQPFANPETVYMAFDTPEARKSFENTQFDLFKTLRELLGIPQANELFDLLRYATDYGFDWLRLDTMGPRIAELGWPT